jgi:hypothetical protein
MGAARFAVGHHEEVAARGQRDAGGHGPGGTVRAFELHAGERRRRGRPVVELEPRLLLAGLVDERCRPDSGHFVDDHVEQRWRRGGRAVLEAVHLVAIRIGEDEEFSCVGDPSGVDATEQAAPEL